MARIRKLETKTNKVGKRSDGGLDNEREVTGVQVELEEPIRYVASGSHKGTTPVRYVICKPFSFALGSKWEIIFEIEAGEEEWTTDNEDWFVFLEYQDGDGSGWKSVTGNETNLTFEKTNQDNAFNAKWKWPGEQEFTWYAL